MPFVHFSCVWKRTGREGGKYGGRELSLAYPEAPPRSTLMSLALLTLPFVQSGDDLTKAKFDVLHLALPSFLGLLLLRESSPACCRPMIGADVSEPRRRCGMPAHKRDERDEAKAT